MTATELLAILGFECLGPDATHADVTMWLRTGGGPDILVQLMREDTHPTDVARAIYAAGQRDKRDEIGGAWKTFTEAVRAPGVSDLWTNARRTAGRAAGGDRGGCQHAKTLKPETSNLKL